MAKVAANTESNGASSLASTGPSKPKRGTIENLRPGWQPGQSGNPSGRAAMPPEVKAALEGASLEAVLKQIELLQCGDPRIEFMASQALLDRRFGKAAQQVDTNITTTTTQQAHLQILVDIQAKREAAAKVIEGEVEGDTQRVEVHDEESARK